MDDIKGAKGSESLDDNTGDKSQSAEGKRPLKSSEQLLSEYKAETQRKQEKIENLENTVNDLKSKYEELLEKQEEKGLSGKEEKQLDDLKGSIREKSQKLRGLEDAQPWIEIAREEAKSESQRASAETMIQHQVELGNEFIEDRASEVKMTPKELAKQLAPYAIKYQDKRPERRNALAFKDWKADESKRQDLEAREKKIKEAEDRETAFREGRGRIQRDPTIKQKFDESDATGRLKSTVDLIG